MASQDLLMTGATLADGRTCDVLARGGLVVDVAEVTRPGPGPGRGPTEHDGTRVVDLQGYLLVAAPVEPHAHLDKALTWDAIRPPVGDLPEAIASWRRWSESLEPLDIRRRVLRAARLLLANGCAAVRTHVDVAAGSTPLKALEVVLAVREELRGAVDLQVVAFALPDATDVMIEDALALGADLLGGLAHLADEPLREHDRLFAAAERAGVGLDLHTDEHLDAGRSTLSDLAARCRDDGFAGPVTASHCSSLAMCDPREVVDVAGAVAAAGLGVVTLPQTNLYLQGRRWPTSPPRGMTAVRALLDAGVPVAAGGDNMQDPFNPMGRGDPLETASLMVTAGHMTIGEAFSAVTGAARRVMGLPDAGPVTGAVADLLAIRAGHLGEAIAAAPADRVVIKGGRVVSTTVVSRTSLLDDMEP